MGFPKNNKEKLDNYLLSKNEPQKQMRPSFVITSLENPMISENVIAVEPSPKSASRPSDDNIVLPSTTLKNTSIE